MEPGTDDNLLGVQTPESGAVSFDAMLFPTPPIYPTKLYLDITKGGTENRYEIKVNDLDGVSSDNAIALLPNRVVTITGDYDKIDTGFTISIGDGLNLDDDAWDGL